MPLPPEHGDSPPPIGRQPSSEYSARCVCATVPAPPDGEGTTVAGFSMRWSSPQRMTLERGRLVLPNTRRNAHRCVQWVHSPAPAERHQSQQRRPTGIGSDAKGARARSAGTWKAPKHHRPQRNKPDYRPVRPRGNAHGTTRVRGTTHHQPLQMKTKKAYERRVHRVPILPVPSHMTNLRATTRSAPPTPAQGATTSTRPAAARMSASATTT